jgi:hypothetical protein
MELKPGNNATLLAWAVALAFVMSLILFGAMLAATYVADEFLSPPLTEASYSPPQAGGGR